MARFGWRPYVSVATRRARAERAMKRLEKGGKKIRPVEAMGRKITRTFWGKAWCAHLEKFSDYENRLPRGRTYVRNGSVCHLEIEEGGVRAVVSGSELYEVRVKIDKLTARRWSTVKKRCAGGIGSLLELLEGRLSKNVMEVVTDRDKGLFPLPGEIGLDCSCPDWAYMCKHVAAVLYGVGARLDEAPELLFLLRGVDHLELIEKGADLSEVTRGKGGKSKRLDEGDLSSVFGIDLDGRKAGRRKKRKPGKKIPPKGGGSGAKAKKKKKNPVSRETPVTGGAVAKLRKKFAMTVGHFALLMEVSSNTVARWEKTKGPLNLQKRSLETWRLVKGLTRKRAWDFLE